MPTSLGAHNARLAQARELRTKKGRREQRAFAFEGGTLLREAVDAGVEIRELYVTAQGCEATPLVRSLEERGVPAFLVDERAMQRLSELETPPGVLAVATAQLVPLETALGEPGLVLLLADVNDPGNAGTLLRSAEAFGARAVVFGHAGVEPHHPKVVRAAMGALFRLQICAASPAEFAAAAQGWEVTGLDARGEPLGGLSWGLRSVLAAGHERHGLGPWAPLCTRLAAIPMAGKAESLNAAVAGAIALYEAAKHLNG